MSRIDTLQTFVSVVRTRNFTAAADALNVTPSAISKQISSLEERLGVRLLNRTTRSVSPTEAGQMFYQHCENILDSINEAEKLVTDFDWIDFDRLSEADKVVWKELALALRGSSD